MAVYDGAENVGPQITLWRLNHDAETASQFVFRGQFTRLAYANERPEWVELTDNMKQVQAASNRRRASEASFVGTSHQTAFAKTRLTICCDFMKETDSEGVVLVTRDQLPMHCPPPNTTLWDGHPKVYIPLEDNPTASCSYCGTQFKLVDASTSSNEN